MLKSLPAPEGWVERMAGLGVVFEPGEVERLGAYLALLLEANERMNLTAIRDAADAWEKHILDALTLVPVLADLPEGGVGCEVIDVGSGGGIPGLVLACVMPRTRFTLLDATGKKCEFLRSAASELGLGHVTVINDRAEKLGQDRGERTGTGRTGGHRDRYDAVVSRAVGRMATLLELTVPLAKVGGLIVLTKGQKADEELVEAKQTLHMLHAAHAGTVDTPTGRIVVVEKLRDTPKAYPRGDGEPKRSPLGVGRG